MSGSDPREGDEEFAIVFFDGHCGLCNHVVDFLLRFDRGRSLRFAPLQGETADRLLADGLTLAPDTIALWSGGEVYLRSRAVLNALTGMGGPWFLLRVLRICPIGVADLFYRLVARNRYSIFGRSESCRLPDQSERIRFLP